MTSDMVTGSQKPISQKLVAVNHKMYFGYAQTVDWCAHVAAIAANHPATASGEVALVVLPSTPVLAAAIECLRPSGVEVGAQNMHWVSRGPFTGEVGAAILAEMGCNVVAVGHAERRALFYESDRDVARKVAVALEHDLAPLVCIGEAEPVTSRAAIAACMRQLEQAFAEIPKPTGRIIVAYEPVWAIGADRPAPPEHVREVCETLSRRMREHLGFKDLSLIYGGAAGPGQWQSFRSSVDGLFLGRRAHDPSRVGSVLTEMLVEQ